VEPVEHALLVSVHLPALSLRHNRHPVVRCACTPPPAHGASAHR
jgi:hypothetical protein